MINKVILIGRTASKPSIKEGKSGNKYCHFSLATNTGYGDKKQTDWHDITSFGKTAELCAQYVDKGSLIMVEGRITYDKYEKDGKTTKTTKIIADNVTFMSGKTQRDESQEIQQIQKQPLFGDDVVSDGIPF